MVRQSQPEDAKAILPVTAKAGMLCPVPEQDGETRHPRHALLASFAACGCTVVLNTVPIYFNHGSTDQECGGKFPACDPQTLQPPSRLPHVLQQYFTCHTLLFILALSTFIHWILIFNLFQQGRWKDSYLNVVLCTTMVCLIPAAFFAQDPATTFVQILPIITDVCVAGCLFREHLLTKRPWTEK
ncbi:hypothetical protein BGZ61DRAFT_454367 [Ilyonectria robusta]|uniref:uncharacterized protein n=1 Tax=Ilyonectria robusta TaxID=1079257 RepID=UPI001E8CDEDB|nr:uncharacterized protein BGZ61DRAFT_454367 [Ilyonectria robusta]KAH8686358.1 hypothetical protein BGZ61DRAFT_454367 [Ilyonectria robusta]